MIVELDRVGDVVIQQIVKPDGSLVRYQYGKPGDAASFQLVNSPDEARKALAPLVGRTVDRNGDLLVQKVTKAGEHVGYRHGSEALGWVHIKTLAEARKAIGKSKVEA